MAASATTTPAPSPNIGPVPAYQLSAESIECLRLKMKALSAPTTLNSAAAVPVSTSAPIPVGLSLFASLSPSTQWSRDAGAYHPWGSDLQPYSPPAMSNSNNGAGVPTTAVDNTKQPKASVTTMATAAK